MMQGDTPASNADPFATGETGPEDWITDLGPHLMVLVPDHELLKLISTDHLNGGPWVMWSGTPYAHIMIPLESRWASRHWLPDLQLGVPIRLQSPNGVLSNNSIDTDSTLGFGEKTGSTAATRL